MNITIVTPNYNHGKWLGETIESILSELSSDDEYFVVDGNSSDESVSVIREYDKFLTGWISEADEGYGDAIAKGFRMGRNPIMCWINSSDLLLRGALVLAKKHLESTKADLIYGDDLHIDEISQVVSRSNGFVSDAPNAMLFGGWTPLQDGCFWRRSLYDQIGGLKGALQYAADFDFFLRAFWSGGNCRYIPAVFSAFRGHVGQKSIRENDFYKWERSQSQREMTSRLALSRTEVFWKALYYGLALRLRYRLSKRIIKQSVVRGTPISEVTAH